MTIKRDDIRMALERACYGKQPLDDVDDLLEAMIDEVMETVEKDLRNHEPPRAA